MKKIFQQLALMLLLVSILTFPYFVFAGSKDDIKTNMDAIAGGYDTTRGSETGLAELIGMIINVGLSLLGVIFIVLTIYAGFNWMTASGDESKIETAKKTLTRAIIGLIIIAGSYAIWNFVFVKLL